MDDSTPFLYVLMRSDLSSLSSGKAMAQATHAANQCVFYIKNTRIIPKADQMVVYDHLAAARVMLIEWEGNRGFGTCIVLDIGNEEVLKKVVTEANHLNLISGVTHDPSYPVRDGAVTHLVPLNTCGFVFGPKHLCKIILRDFSLY